MHTFLNKMYWQAFIYIKWSAPRAGSWAIGLLFFLSKLVECEWVKFLETRLSYPAGAANVLNLSTIFSSPHLGLHIPNLPIMIFQMRKILLFSYSLISQGPNRENTTVLVTKTHKHTFFGWYEESIAQDPSKCLASSSDSPKWLQALFNEGSPTPRHRVPRWSLPLW